MEFLRQEYAILQEAIEKLDEKALTIKAWSVTLSMAGIGVAFLEDKAVIILLSAASACLFWILDALWKSFQQAFYYRARRIENYMAGKADKEISSPDIVGAWSAGWKQVNKLRIAFWPQVYLPHAAVAAGGFLLWLIEIINLP